MSIRNRINTIVDQLKEKRERDRESIEKMTAWAKEHPVLSIIILLLVLSIIGGLFVPKDNSPSWSEIRRAEREVELKFFGR